MVNTLTDGSLDTSSFQTITLGWQPTDVTVGLGPVDPFSGTRTELAVVVGRDDSTSRGKIHIIMDTAFPSIGDTLLLAIGSKPVAVAIREDGTRAYVADEATGEIRIVNLETRLLLTKKLPVDGTVRRVATQRSLVAE